MMILIINTFHYSLLVYFILFIILNYEGIVFGQITTQPRDQPRRLHLHSIHKCCDFQDHPAQLLLCANRSSYENKNIIYDNMRRYGGPTLGMSLLLF
jgi:hypothetical protein